MKNPRTANESGSVNSVDLLLNTKWTWNIKKLIFILKQEKSETEKIARYA